MRLLTLFAAAVCACAQTFPPLVDAQNTIDWIAKIQASGVQVDTASDVYFAGTLEGGGVPVTYTLGPGGGSDIVVFKLDARFEQIRYVTVIGGSGVETLNGMQVDGLGHVYLAGTTYSSAFPVTKRLDGATAERNGFVLRLSTSGDEVDWSVAMPLDTRVMALGSDGGIYFGGSLFGGPVPITPGAYITQRPNPFSGYVMKVRAADGDTEFATWVNQRVLSSMVARRGGGVVFTGEGALVALNGAGSQADFGVTLGGSTNLLAADGTGNVYVYTPNRLTKYSPRGAPLQTTETGSGFSGSAMAVSEDGTAYLLGSAIASFATRNSAEACYANRSGAQQNGGVGSALVAVSRTGEVTYSGFTSTNFQAMAVGPGGRYLSGPAAGVGPWSLRGVVRMDLLQLRTSARLSPACLANGASYESGAVTPGEIMTIYGSGIGPAKGVSFALVNGRVPTELAGVSVTVDGVPAPVLYAQDAQINFIVPWSTRPFGTMPICVSRNGDRVCMESWGRVTDIAIFGDAQGPIVTSPDGTRTTRVPSSGYITLYLTGTGVMDGSVEDGGVSGFPLRRMAAQGRAMVNDTVPVCAPMGNCRQLPDAQIVYAGNSPGLVWGVTQMNIKLPELNPGTYDLKLVFSSSPTSPSIRLDVYRP